MLVAVQFGGVPVSPAGQVVGVVVQFGGVPVSPVGQVGGVVVQFGGVPVSPVGHVVVPVTVSVTVELVEGE